MWSQESTVIHGLEHTLDKNRLSFNTWKKWWGDTTHNGKDKYFITRVVEEDEGDKFLVRTD